MKQLVVTTGFKDYIINRYLPSLRNKGEYNEDILLVNYGDFNDKDIELLRNSKVSVLPTKKVYPCIPSDRIRAFYECLKLNDLYKQYDVIMVTDGNDIEYFKPIQPLFELAKDKFSYCIETPEHLVSGWIKFTEYPNANEVWNIIKSKPMINAGMMIGPSDSVMKALEFITEQTKYNSKFGADQMLINALIYYYNFPSQEVDNKWNYAIYANHRRMITPVGGKVYAAEDGKEIAILHRNGPQHMDYEKWRKIVFPACKMPNEGWMNRINTKVVNKTIGNIRFDIDGNKERGGIAHTNEELQVMYKLLIKAITLEGDIAEVGVFKGGTASFISKYKSNKKLHLFDTFEGLPETKEDDLIEPYGRYKERRRLMKGEVKYSLEDVQKNLSMHTNIYFYKGIFPNTSDPIKDTKFSFVHLDVDIYTSTIDSLNFFYPRMVKGGIILIHDYHMCSAIKKATSDFLIDKPETLLIEGNQCYIIKDEAINIPIDDLVIYPYWNDKVHLEISNLEWLRKEYPVLVDNHIALELDIKKNGIKDCLLVEKLFDDKYGIIDGNHRFYSALRLGIVLLPCKIITLEEKQNSITKQQSIGTLEWKDMFKHFKWNYIDINNLEPDKRILRIKEYYDIQNRNVIELGAFEGRDTYALRFMNPRTIVSLEGRLTNYMKCNLMKFAFKMDNVDYEYKDIEKTDLTTLGVFDFCLARGIFHHLTNPVNTIKQISKVSNNLWLGIRLTSTSFNSGEESVCEEYKGRKFIEKPDNIFQGLYNYSFWLYKDELLRLLNDLGFAVTIIKEPKIYNEKDNYAEIYAKK